MIDINDHEKVILLTYPFIAKAFDVAMREVEDPMIVFGTFMGYLAKEFERYNYNENDWKDFLKELSEAGWPINKPTPEPEPIKPKLTLVK